MTSKSLVDFLNGEACVLADPSVNFTANIKAFLVSQGVDSQTIYIANTYEAAQAFIKEKKPRLLISEYSFDENHGFSLIEELRKLHTSAQNCIAIVSTKESADSVIVEAAEEELDAFVIKPFSAATFAAKLNEVVANKTNPTPYQSKVELAKIKIENNKFEEAAILLKEAKGLHKSPALACNYLGICYKELGDNEASLAEFNEGLGYNKIHYYCLINKFELLVKTKQFAEAFKQVDVLIENFPITPVRLGQIYVACIFSENFQKIDKLYEQLLKIQVRPEGLIKIAITAMMASGRHFFKAGDKLTAVKHFDIASILSGRDFACIEKLVNVFVKAKDVEIAEQFLAKVRSELVGTPQYNALAFKIDLLTLQPDEIIDKGRKVIEAGGCDAYIFKSLIDVMLKTGRISMAEGVAMTAIQKYPELREYLHIKIEKAQKSQNELL